MSTVLIKNGTVVTATDFYKGDVYVEGETIKLIGTALTMDADRVVDARAVRHPRHRRPHAPRHAFGDATSADD